MIYNNSLSNVSNQNNLALSQQKINPNLPMIPNTIMQNQQMISPNIVNPILPINVLNPIHTYPNSQQPMNPPFNANQMPSQYYPPNPSTQTNISTSQVATKKKTSTMDQGTSPD